MTAAELARKVRLVELRARKTVGGAISGAYHSAFKGQGVEFQEVREYVPGDDTRSIDWNVTARVGRPYIKRFAEERDQTVMLLLDGSRSNLFGTGAAPKNEAAAEVFAVLAFAAVYNKDEAGLILFTDEVEHYVPPGRGPTHVLRLVRDVLAFQPRGRGTNINGALEFLGKVRRRRSLAVLISDFLADDFEQPLRAAARRHDLIAISIFDPREERLPDCGLVEVEDAESGRRCTIDTSHPQVRAAWESAAREQTAALGALFRSAHIDHLRIEAGTDYLRPLIPFLRLHGARD
jgi:uncharacterized protein (DUF58 family)